CGFQTVSHGFTCRCHYYRHHNRTGSIFSLEIVLVHPRLDDCAVHGKVFVRQEAATQASSTTAWKNNTAQCGDATARERYQRTGVSIVLGTGIEVPCYRRVLPPW